MSRRRKCSCELWGVAHRAPWSPCCPDLETTGNISTESLGFSGRTGVDTRRSDYQTWRLQKQEPSDYHKAVIRELRGPELAKLEQAAHYVDQVGPCQRCGQEALTIAVHRGDQVKILDFCSCQFGPELLAKQRERDEERARYYAREADLEREAREKRQRAEEAAARAARLELEAQNCAEVMLKSGPRCVADQSFPECGFCHLSRRVKRTKADRPAGYVPPIRPVEMVEI